MKTKLNLLLLACIFITSLNSCFTVSSTARLYSELSISADRVKIRTVAIVPNRMPINLQDPEKWRTYNWDLIAAQFTARGFRVIDYNTTVNTFTRSGLPLEDTKSSRDKYAEFANEINAELVVIPYYGTSYNMQGGFFNNTHKYLSIGSLQFYYAPKNDFMARIDFEGEFQTSTTAPGAYMLAGFLPMFGTLTAGETTHKIAGGASYTTPDPADPIWSTLSLVLDAVFFITDLTAPTTPEPNWKKAFEKGIVKATDAFFEKYSPRPIDNYPEPARQLVPAASPYSSFSIEELDLLKKNAIDKKDFKKAGEIKLEIDRRK